MELYEAKMKSGLSLQMMGLDPTYMFQVRSHHSRLQWPVDTHMSLLGQSWGCGSREVQLSLPTAS